MDNLTKTLLAGLTPEETASLLTPGKEKYRGMQIFRWIHERCAASFGEMTNLSASLRTELEEKFSISPFTGQKIVSSSDRSTEKFLWELSDGISIEGVVIRDEGRTTACVSSQAGCRMGCKFCRTAGMGFKRNLTAGEIVYQLVEIRKFLRSRDEDLTNIVFMGMGEPLDNLENVLKAVRIITLETGLSIGQRKITISTSGILPGMSAIGRKYKKLGLAISLNAVTDELRSRLMPINRKYPISELLSEAREFTKLTHRRVTFEYILLAGVNDSNDDALKLLSIARSVPSKVNLIAYNEYPGSPFQRPSDSRIEEFQKILFDGNVTAFLRRSKGGDILAACGQLASEK